MAYQIVSMHDAAEVTAEVERGILDKIGKLDKYLTELDDDTFFIRVQLDRNQQNPHWTDAQVRLTLPQDILIGHGSASFAVHAVHLAVRDVERQLSDYKVLTHPGNPMVS